MLNFQSAELLELLVWLDADCLGNFEFLAFLQIVLISDDMRLDVFEDTFVKQRGAFNYNLICQYFVDILVIYFKSITKPVCCILHKLFQAADIIHRKKFIQRPAILHFS